MFDPTNYSHDQYMRSVGGLMQAVEFVASRLSDFDSYVNDQDDEDVTPCRGAYQIRTLSILMKLNIRRWNKNGKMELQY